jgi:putative transposase
MLAERGVIVSYESIRMWCQRFGTQIAAKIRRDRPAPAGKWHLDEVVMLIRGQKHWLWRAVDSNGDVLEILIQNRRNAHAAKRFLMKLMKRWGVPRVLVPPSSDIAFAMYCRAVDKLRSYGVAVRDLCPSADHRSHKALNNRSEASHRHTRRREKIMGRFKPPRQAQRFLSVHDQTTTIFRPKRHRLSAVSYRQSRVDAFSLWNNYAAEMAA